MSRDPFEEMQKRNPVTRDELPMAPMPVAETILGRRARGAMPGWAMAAAAAFLVATVGGGMLLWLAGGDAAPVGSGGTTTSTGVSTTAVTPVAVDGAVYFFLEQTGEGWQGGPFLVPLAVEVEAAYDGSGGSAAQTATLAHAVIERLLQGPGEHATSVPAMSTAIPEGTAVNGVGVEEGTGIVIVDLSSEFASAGGSASMIGRVAQVVYTLTRLDGVDGVRFEIGGVPTTVFGGEGFTVEDPATRRAFEGLPPDSLVPAVMIESPAYGGEAGYPLIATGTANVFEATVSVTLTDGDGLIIFEGFTTASCGTGCRGEWEISVEYDTSTISQAGEWGSLITFESSAEDSRPINVREHPVWLHGDADPADTTTTSIAPFDCSGHLWETPFAEQPGLPEAVAEKRAAIWDAVVECDWDQLQRLLGPGFSFTFGGGDDSIDAPIHHWQYLEAQGEQPMLFLAELLNRPFGTIESEGVTYYVWPSVHTKEWDAATQAEIERLRPLYGDEDFSDFEAFGAYFGYRVGITDNGDWVYFIAGD